jgi:phage baseplate assembly protein W
MKAIYMPFQFKNGSTRSTTITERIVEQQILDVLTTSKYERVMIPQYGAAASNLLFDVLDDPVLADFKTEAMLDLQEYVDGAEIIDMRFQYGSDSGEWDYNTSLQITVIYRIPPSAAKGFTFTVSE